MEGTTLTCLETYSDVKKRTLIGSTVHSTFQFIFLVSCMVGEAKVPSQCWLRMLCSEVSTGISSEVPYVRVVREVSEHPIRACLLEKCG
jgi:hypothetical protein